MSENLIIVGTPSFNEEDNISHVTQTADEGLETYFPESEAVIVNLDQSEDDTREHFLATETTFPKEYVRPGPEIGKGRSLISLLEYADERAEDFDNVCILTIDADITSVQPAWIEKLATPVLETDVNFVTANYERNRYEGNTTNHFCYPLVSAIYDCDLRQPIAGDFSMDYEACKTFLSAPKTPAVYRYGIDYFFSLTALENDLNVKESSLGKKIHKPSFGKMVPMFREIAATTFFLLSRGDHTGTTRSIEGINNSSAIADYVDKPSQEAVEERLDTAVGLLTELSGEDATDCEPISTGFVKNKIQQQCLTREMWCDILGQFLRYIDGRSVSTEEANRLAEVITPFYLLRVLTYFENIEGKSKAEVEIELEEQKTRLKEAID
ncbi:glycosyltransferase (plasmid) [Halorussus salilacus]|uniref:glycosyltransferase n=1 Tax=Halorussus salilacus TaxID=2953750 RepID=UPI0020A0E485|nr:glycosyltransferase [Halorussus salilacus]USZ70010.1 glycosyltransferase [Halorussus salilacus]